MLSRVKLPSRWLCHLAHIKYPSAVRWVTKRQVVNLGQTLNDTFHSICRRQASHILKVIWYHFSRGRVNAAASIGRNDLGSYIIFSKVLRKVSKNPHLFYSDCTHHKTIFFSFFKHFSFLILYTIAVWKYLFTIISVHKGERCECEQVVWKMGVGKSARNKQVVGSE